MSKNDESSVECHVDLEQLACEIEANGEACRDVWTGLKIGAGVGALGLLIYYGICSLNSDSPSSEA